MKAFKAGQVLSHWLLRLALFGFVSFLFWKTFAAFNLNDVKFYIAAAGIVFAVLLLLGGLLAKPNLTVISGLVLTVIFAYFFIVGFSGSFSHENLLNLLLAVVGFHFFTRGN